MNNMGGEFFVIMMSAVTIIVIGIVLFSLFFIPSASSGIPPGIEMFTRLMYR